ncbi:MAG: hypothetical protein WDN04_11665 [Rhodospirillales bacterium]
MKDGRIEAVTKWVAAPTDGAVTDWSHYMVLPGLIDMHTHIADWEQTSNDAEALLHSAQDVALVGAAHARKTLRAVLRRCMTWAAIRAFTDVRCATRSIAAGGGPADERGRRVYYDQGWRRRRGWGRRRGLRCRRKCMSVS